MAMVRSGSLTEYVKTSEGVVKSRQISSGIFTTDLKSGDTLEVLIQRNGSDAATTSRSMRC